MDQEEIADPAFAAPSDHGHARKDEGTSSAVLRTRFITDILERTEMLEIQFMMDSLGRMEVQIMILRAQLITDILERTEDLRRRYEL